MKKGWLLTGSLALIIAGAGVGGTIYYGSDDTLPKGFTVGGLTVGGQSAPAALNLLQNRVADLEQIQVTAVLPAGGTGDIKVPDRTLKQLGMSVDTSDAMKAIEKFRDASWLNRARMRFEGGMKSSYGLSVNWNEQQFQQEAQASWGSAAGAAPKDAERTINDQDEVIYTDEVLGTELDLPALFNKVKNLEPKTLSPKMSSSSAEAYKVELPITETAPEITVAKLKEEGIERKIAEFTTSFTTSGKGRSHNVTAAAKALNETLLMPDDVFEYGKIVAKAEKEYGYKEAPVILKGKLVPGVGGGICQVSSTLYNAALRVGLDIVERRNHSLRVHYLPAGLDATFADGFVNFKFRNSTGKQLLIRTVVHDKRLTVKLFGTMPENVEYRTETVEVKVNKPKTVYVANDKLTLGKQDTVQKGESGYVVESYLVKLVDGNEVERKKLSRDTYRTQDNLIAVNPQDPRLNPEGSTPAPTPDPTPSPGQDEGPVEPV
ncbi:VanW family protein [Cohnella kolymensis]|uniref:VanW family protein n=1 Tax=Cohnella kolymensis TaxID=1590652 RepID=UPI000698FED5|nr:VanW family protein [Cohnella kolymensis]